MLAAEQHARAAGRCSSGMTASTSYRVESGSLLSSRCPPRRSTFICQAKKDDDDPGMGKAKGSGSGNKADFSAFWSMKVRNFFSSRRLYLDKADADVKKVKRRPKVLDWLDDKIDKTREEIEQKQWEDMQGREDPAERRVRLEREAGEWAASKLGLPPPPPPSEGKVVLRAAQTELVPSWTAAVSLSLYRAKQLVQGVLMAPWTLMVAAFQAWQRLFTTQHYEMFLMTEGERIWYWRNRTENERWFWEIFAWDRLLFPIICTVAYEYIVPANLVWVVVVPAVFIMWQTGQLPGPFNLEFWLIAYFGVYKKCWHDVVGLAMALFQWA